MKLIQLSILCGAMSGALSLRAADQPAMPVPTLVAPEAVEERFVDLFKPFKTDQATLSPDGKYIAYSVREGETLSIVVVEIDNPGKIKTKVTVISDDMATPMLGIDSKEKTPGKIRWMRWATPTRVIVETNRNFPYNLWPESGGEWLNCSGEILGFDADGKNAESLVTPKDTAEWDTAITTKNNVYPRSPHIVDFHPTNNGSVVIQADGFPRPHMHRYIERFRLDATTGKLSSMSKNSPPIDRAFLFDRDGKPRISVSTVSNEPFPHAFEYNSGSLTSRWKPLDQLVSLPNDKGFALSPENYFNERAIPLGFSRTGDLLYFASNSGRDTYGIYALDTKSWKRIEFAAESPVFDLFTPSPGTFPDTNGGALFVRDELPLNQTNWEPPVAIRSEPFEDPNGTGRSQKDRQQEADDKRQQDENQKTASAEYAARIKQQWRSAPLIGNIHDNPLIYDRFQHDVIGFRFEGKTRTVRWFKPEIQKVQDDMEQKFPGCSIDVMEWDAPAQRFLIRTRGQREPGAFYVYDSNKAKLSEFVVRAPWLNPEKLHPTNDFSIQTTDGQTITGSFTFPRAARSVPVPAIVLCPTNPWERIHADFRPEVHALAEMGFAVIQVNARGAWGYGIKNRLVINNGLEEAQVADICHVIDSLSKRYAINPKHVAIFGKNLGGYLALRAAQIAPARFRCAIALDSEVDLKSWIEQARWQSGDSSPALISAFFGNTEKLNATPLFNQTEKIKSSILLLNFRGALGESETLTHVNARRLVSAVKSNDVTAELSELSDDYMANLPRAKAEAFRKIEDFLNTYIYDFKVKMGELKHIEDPK